MTFWITKYALTRGIFKAEGCEVREGYVCRASGRCSSADYLFVKLGAGAFETESEAMGDALKKVRAKLASLAKEKAKLEAMIPGFTGAA